MIFRFGKRLSYFWHYLSSTCGIRDYNSPVTKTLSFRPECALSRHFNKHNNLVKYYKRSVWFCQRWYSEGNLIINFK